MDHLRRRELRIEPGEGDMLSPMRGSDAWLKNEKPFWLSAKIWRDASQIGELRRKRLNTKMTISCGRSEKSFGNGMSCGRGKSE